MTFGKVIGGGMPVGAFGGRADIMEKLAPLGPVYQAGTLSGNPVAMAAGLATMRVLEREDGFTRLEELGNYFEQALRTHLKGVEAAVVRMGSIIWLVFQTQIPRRADQIETKAIQRFNARHRAVLDRGVYLPPSGYEVMFVSLAHTEAMLEKGASVIGEVVRA
jgi:glutamate-1-semialdehyde 2,1-aminomutase